MTFFSLEERKGDSKIVGSIILIFNRKLGILWER